MPATNYLTWQQRALLDSIVTKYGYTNTNYSAHSNALNAPTVVANDPAPQVPRTLSLQDITDGLQPATVKKLAASGCFSSFLDGLSTQNHDNVSEIIAVWEKAGDFTTEEIASLQQLTSQTMPQPGWPATKLGPSIWQAEFYAIYPTFAANVDGSVYTDQCHPLFVKEARGDAS